MKIVYRLPKAMAYSVMPRQSSPCKQGFLLTMPNIDDEQRVGRRHVLASLCLEAMIGDDDGLVEGGGGGGSIGDGSTSKSYRPSSKKPCPGFGGGGVSSGEEPPVSKRDSAR